MHKVSKYKFDVVLFLLLILLAIISISTVYSAESLSSAAPGALALKQGIWFLIGFIVIFIIMTLGTDFFFRYAWVFYFIGILSLIGLLLFAPTISNSKCWFVIPKVGNIQPSEFMKIFLILVLARMIEKFNSNPHHSIKDEFIFILKVIAVVGVPSILTFMQPDTGVVIIYLLITVAMLFASGLRIRWFAIAGVIIGVVAAIFLFLYFAKSETFIHLFGTKFFYRMDRIIDWKSGVGMQYENASIAIGSAGLFGHGFANTPIYFPEPQTDFIFAVFASNFGMIGSLILLIILGLFDAKIMHVGFKSKNTLGKHVVAGIIGMLLYQQLQNIGMTIGLVPITGITLPFISYGGSSLLSYMLMIGFVFTIANEDLRNKKQSYF